MKRGTTASLQRRLLVMLIVPLFLLVLLNAWLDYRSADNVALQQDQRLLALVPLVGDSVIGESPRSGEPPLLLLAPALDDFLHERHGPRAYAVMDGEGTLLSGADWLAGSPPTTGEPEFHSEQMAGVTWRIVRQRQRSVLGEIVVALADGSDPRQQWGRLLLGKLLMPNLLLLVAAALALRWTVQRALKPLLDLKEAVERRSPGDLSPIDEASSPNEVQPLVQSLNRLFGMVNAQAESQRRFVADAAHQLRTPLAGLQAQVEAWTQAAQRTPDRDALSLPTEHLHKLRDATRRTSQLAHQLLALSRADARGIQNEPMHPVDLKSLCETTLENHLDRAMAKRLDLGLEAEPVEVLGHEWLLRELLSNLVDNAIKYTPEGGSVTLRCWKHDGRAFLEVEDDGPGVDPAERPRILERFYRVPGSQGDGSGLGLAIAEEIARVHRTHLHLDTGSLGRGLRVSLRLQA